MSHLGTALRVVAVIAGVAVVAGCQNFPDLGGQPHPAPPPADVPAAVPSDPAPENVTLDRPTIRRLQAGLARLGHRPGPLDGIAGPRTAEAVERYRAAHGLPPGTAITAKLLRHLAATLAGKKAGRQGPPNLDPADFPAYLPGTSYVYSDGNIERVAAANGAQVQWVRGNGTTFTADRNFLVPWSSWSSHTERGTAKISAEADALWPRRKGAEVAFTATEMVQRPELPDVTERREADWRCRNDGRQEVTVGIGKFDALVLVCARGEKDAAPDLIRTWYYAKSIRHYVRFVERRPALDTTRTSDLVAIRPGVAGWPPIVRAALNRAVVHALDSEGDVARMPWTSSGVKTSVIIEAKSRFAADDGKLCRRFVQIWSTGGRSRSFPAVACKTISGRWAIPGLEGSVPLSLVTSGGTG